MSATIILDEQVFPVTQVEFINGELRVSGECGGPIRIGRDAEWQLLGSDGRAVAEGRNPVGRVNIAAGASLVLTLTLHIDAVGGVPRASTRRNLFEEGKP